MDKYTGGTGFKSAGAYYATLKRKFIQSCTEAYDVEQQAQLSQTLGAFDNKLYNRFQEFQKVKKDRPQLDDLLPDASEAIIKALEGETSLKEEIELLAKKYEEGGRQATEDIKKESQRIIQKIRNLLASEDNILQSIKQIVNKSSGGTTLAAVENEYLSYISRQIAKQMTLITQIFDLNSSALAGYYQEATESQAMHKVMKEFGGRAAHAGTMTHQGVETPMDIVIGRSNSGKNLQVRALKEYEQLLDIIGQFNTTASVSDVTPNWDTILRDVKIKTAGVQSKLYTINFTQPRPGGYSIGSRAGLKTNFYTWAKKRAITQALSAEYFNESYTAIIEAFGANTLLFRTGSQRFFVDELLHELQEHNFKIAFNLSAGNKLTNTVKMMQDVDETTYINDDDVT